jgi:hypothetical protein
MKTIKLKQLCERVELKLYARKHYDSNGDESRKKGLDFLLNRLKSGKYNGTNKDILSQISKLMSVNEFMYLRRK